MFINFKDLSSFARCVFCFAESVWYVSHDVYKSMVQRVKDKIVKLEEYYAKKMTENKVCLSHPANSHLCCVFPSYCLRFLPIDSLLRN